MPIWHLKSLRSQTATLKKARGGHRRLCRYIAMHKVVVRKLDKFRLKFEDQFKVVFDVIRQLTASQAPGRKRVGFEVPE